MTIARPPRSQGNPRSTNAPHFGSREIQIRQPMRAATLVVLSLILVSFRGIALASHGGEARGEGEVPSKATDLYRTDKVWSIHLRFTPEQWAKMEPEGGGGNPFDGS